MAINFFVSVIIPTYGGGDSLKRTINSVLVQSYSNFEVIVVDDNGLGTENQKRTDTIMKEFEWNSKVNYICHKKNLNGSAARNTGARYAKGEYIAFLDDDDEYLPNYIEDQLKVIASLTEEYALTYCSFEKKKAGKTVSVVHAKESGWLMYKIMTHRFEIPTTSWLMRKSAFESIGGFDESFKRHQDWEFIARLAFKYKIMANDRICYMRHLQFRNSPRNYAQTKAFRLHYLNKMQPYIEKLPVNQQKKIKVINILDVSVKHFNEIGVKGLIHDFINNKCGFIGILFLAERLYNIIKRGKLRIA